MNMKNTKHRNGFTLIELILTLVLVGFVGALILPFFYSGVFTSDTPMKRVEKNQELQSFLDNAMEVFYDSSNGYYGFNTTIGLQPLRSDDFSNGTVGPMPDFASWLDANWNSLEGKDAIKNLNADYVTVEPTEASPYYTEFPSDKKVVRVVVEAKSGLKLVLYLGQDIYTQNKVRNTQIQ